MVEHERSVPIKSLQRQHPISRFTSRLELRARPRTPPLASNSFRNRKDEVRLLQESIKLYVLYRVYKQTVIWAIFSCFFDPKFFSKMTLIRYNFMRGNRLRPFLKLENASLTLNQGIGVCVLKRKSKMFRFSGGKFI